MLKNAKISTCLLDSIKYIDDSDNDDEDLEIDEKPLPLPKKKATEKAVIRVERGRAFSYHHHHHNNNISSSYIEPETNTGPFEIGMSTLHRTMCNDIRHNIAAMIGEELQHIKNKILAKERGEDVHSRNAPFYPNIVTRWTQYFKKDAIKAYNNECLKGLRVILEEMVSVDCFKGIFRIDSFSGVVEKEGGFFVDFGPESITPWNKNESQNIKTFPDEFSAAIVREQILDHLKLTTDNVCYYTDTNFTDDEWKVLKAMSAKINEFGVAYKI